MDFDNMIPLYRRRNRIKQAQMARDLDVSPSYLCKVEKGVQQSTAEFRKKCASYLKVDEEVLFPKKMDRKNLRSMREKGRNNLWTVRREKSIKQYTLAKLLGCSPSYLSKVEKGQQMPSERFRKKCARILKVKESQLFETSD